MARELMGHSDVVYSVVWSASGSSLASASYGHTLRLWQVGASGEADALAVQVPLKQALLGGMEPDGTSLASGSEDGAVWAWRLMDVNSMRLAIQHLTNKHDWVLNEREILLSGGSTVLLEMEPSRMPSETSTAEGRATAEGCGCSAASGAASRAATAPSMTSGGLQAHPFRPGSPCCLDCFASWAADGKCDAMCNTTSCGHD